MSTNNGGWSEILLSEFRLTNKRNEETEVDKSVRDADHDFVKRREKGE